MPQKLTQSGIGSGLFGLPGWVGYPAGSEVVEVLRHIMRMMCNMRIPVVDGVVVLRVDKRADAALLASGE